ncbi:MAG: hypothetical protein B5M56_01435 [Desulfococcus sp. 4484_241]|nr:MAG: hypothetical protein B5M56_01435 [Desulfococcus sp. 4484_241]
MIFSCLRFSDARLKASLMIKSPKSNLLLFTGHNTFCQVFFCIFIKKNISINTTCYDKSHPKHTFKIKS